MKITFLSPDYWKWLQLNPQLARLERQSLGIQAERLQQQGNIAQAKESIGQAFEIARAIILSPVNEPQDTRQTGEDLTAFGALAIYLARQYRLDGAAGQATQVLADSEQQLRALLPLFVTQPQVCRLIQSIMESLRTGQDFEARRQVERRTLH